LVDALRAAVRAVDEADVPGDLRPAAFDIAARALLAGKPEEPAQNLGRPLGDGRGRADESSSTAAISRRLRVGDDLVTRVFDVDEDGVHLLPSRNRFDSTKRGAMQEVARLMVAARQALGLEEWTPVDVVRAACDERGVLDPTNFGKALTGMGEGFRLRGPTRKREIKANNVGYEAAGELVKRLTSED
jgi:hypothetical protein